MSQIQNFRMKTVVRVRPFSPSERNNGDISVVVGDGNVISVLNPKLAQQSTADSRSRINRYSFDFCFVPEDAEDHHTAPTQAEVYQNLGLHIVASIHNNRNVCLMAYGQSGSGKTYTLFGTETNPGLTLQILEDLFNEFSSEDDFRCEISCIDILNTEKLKDLLSLGYTAPNFHKKTVSQQRRSSLSDFSFKTFESSRRPYPGQLKIREHPKIGPYVEGLTQLTFTDYDELRSTIFKTIRSVRSNQSHMIFSFLLKTRSLERLIQVVDLAASDQCQSETNDQNNLMNKSLSTLGHVISIFTKQSASAGSHNNNHHNNYNNINDLKSNNHHSGLSSCIESPCESRGSSPSILSTSSTDSFHSASSLTKNLSLNYIPFRDSKLTWLLRECFSGKCSTYFISTISPSSGAFSETLNTLRYCQRVSQVRIPVLSSHTHDSSMADYMRSHKLEIQLLQNEVDYLRETFTGIVLTSVSNKLETKCVEILKRILEKEGGSSDNENGYDELKAIKENDTDQINHDIDLVKRPTGAEMDSEHASELKDNCHQDPLSIEHYRRIGAKLKVSKVIMDNIINACKCKYQLTDRKCCQSKLRTENAAQTDNWCVCRQVFLASEETQTISSDSTTRSVMVQTFSATRNNASTQTPKELEENQVEIVERKAIPTINAQLLMKRQKLYELINNNKLSRRSSYASLVNSCGLSSKPYSSLPPSEEKITILEEGDFSSLTSQTESEQATISVNSCTTDLNSEKEVQ